MCIRRVCIRVIIDVKLGLAGYPLSLSQTKPTKTNTKPKMLNTNALIYTQNNGIVLLYGFVYADLYNGGRFTHIIANLL